MKKTLALLALCLFLFPASLAHSTEIKAIAAKLSEKEKADVVRMQAYLNDLKTISANFLQVGDSGALRHGKIDISRPGKMRVAYDLPDKDFIIADGSMVHMWDDELGQQTSLPAGEGIADFILRDPVKLVSNDITITHFVRYPAKIELSLVSTKNPGEGELTLVFEDNPLQLRQWRVLDPQGRTTGVNLENARFDVSFPSNHFVFVSPKLGKARDDTK
ncbi:MAG: outer membrane lipoprotein carrier protein LolA [Proteobacteria bacterium]|jgi:outer membrane lipoprotein-sorting protein|nr:outer membrane lipoprotein carrier protein LolA [Alphaproteobacteria bacterium]NCC03202.1 outer membrane lipoprotein carrier protein LolA [Pseudomonadota bacterium]